MHTIIIHLPLDSTLVQMLYVYIEAQKVTLILTSVFSARCNRPIYIQRLSYDASVRRSVCGLSVCL